MRPIALSLLMILAMALSGCGRDDPGSPDGTTGHTPLAEGTIGAGGGELIGNDIVLTVPAGAFAGDEDLSIFDDTQDWGDISTQNTQTLVEQVKPVFAFRLTAEFVDQQINLMHLGSQVSWHLNRRHRDRRPHLQMFQYFLWFFILFHLESNISIFIGNNYQPIASVSEGHEFQFTHIQATLYDIPG